MKINCKNRKKSSTYKQEKNIINYNAWLKMVNIFFLYNNSIGKKY